MSLAFVPCARRRVIRSTTGHRVTLAEVIQRAYIARRDRIVNPDGSFDSSGRWYPSTRENAGITVAIRSPSCRWPYSYLLACRTHKHVTALVLGALRGYDVPDDIARAVAPIMPALAEMVG